MKLALPVIRILFNDVHAGRPVDIQLNNLTVTIRSNEKQPPILVMTKT